MNVRVVTATTPHRLEALVGLLVEDGWQLVGPVQVACGADADGGWNTLYTATLTREEDRGDS